MYGSRHPLQMEGGIWTVAIDCSENAQNSLWVLGWPRFCTFSKKILVMIAEKVFLTFLSTWQIQVIVQHGGAVADTYDSTHCTHLLALHKKSDTFARVC